MTEPDPKPAKRKSWFDTQWVVALSAVAISFLALWVSVYEVSIMRREERAQVWPYLDMSLSYSEAGFGIEARNKGIGPALVGDVNLTLDGSTYRDWMLLLDDQLGPGHGITYATLKATDIRGRVMSADERADVFLHPWSPAMRQLGEVLPERGQLNYCYCSIHAECWRVAGTKREVVDDCPGAPQNPSR